MTFPPVSSGTVFIFSLISLLSILCLSIFIGLIGLYRAIFKTKAKKRLLLKVSTTLITIGGLGFLCAGTACILLLFQGVQNNQSVRMIMPAKTVGCLKTPLEDPYVLAIY